MTVAEKPTAEQIVEQHFLEDTAEHQMTILRDDGVNRHVRFSKPNTGICRFDIITWPGYLCYTGDMGTYVFRHLPDMFEFFRKDYPPAPGRNFRINPGYWAEKCRAGNRSGCGDGVKEYDQDKFEIVLAEAIDEYVADHVEDWIAAGDRKKAFALRDEASEHFYGVDDEHSAHEALRDFEFDGKIVFYDTWEWNLKEYTHSFLWCCFALVWGIAKYDASKITPQEACFAC